MRAVFISDTHTKHAEVTVPPGDALFHCGDWSENREDQVVSFLTWFAAQPHAHKAFICGNHDWVGEKHPDLLRRLIAKHAPACVYLEDSGTEVMGLKVWGSPVQPRFLDWAFNRDRGAVIRAHWDLIPDDTDILLTHGPVYGRLDWSIYGDEHVGCRDLYEAVLRVRCRVHACGHIHGSWGRDQLVHDDGSKTILLNASVCDEGYRPVNAPWVLDL